jgi:hypothetical protein
VIDAEVVAGFSTSITIDIDSGKISKPVKEMAVDKDPLGPLPPSFGPSPFDQRPRQQRKHGRQYSVQLDIEENPVEHEDSESEREGKELPALPRCQVQGGPLKVADRARL